MLIALGEKAKLSNNFICKAIYTKYKLTKKDRRHSGRYTPRVAGKGKYSEMIANAEEPQEEYDDWIERRDSMRDWNYLEWKKRDKKKHGKKRSKRM